MADELDWLELLVASERIEKWLSVLCRTQNSLSTRFVGLKHSVMLWDDPSRFGPCICRRQAMQQMAEAVMEREAYAEEVRPPITTLFSVGEVMQLCGQADTRVICRRDKQAQCHD